MLSQAFFNLSFNRTAYNYENEATVGEATRRTIIPREELFIISKLHGTYHRYDNVIDAIQESLYRCNPD